MAGLGLDFIENPEVHRIINISIVLRPAEELLIKEKTSEGKIMDKMRSFCLQGPMTSDVEVSNYLAWQSDRCTGNNLVDFISSLTLLWHFGSGATSYCWSEGFSEVLLAVFRTMLPVSFQKKPLST